MLTYIFKRFVQSIITLVVIVSAVFILMRFMPEEGYFGDMYEKLDGIQRETILKNMGLRDPIHKQLVRFYKQLLKGNLGKSIVYRPNTPIIEIISLKLPYSLFFGLISIGLALIIGIPLGILMIFAKGGVFDKLGSTYIILINSVPSAIYYLVFQIYITKLFRFPILFSQDEPSSWILPVISMSLGGIASYAMWIRRYMADELNRDYVKFARAKGLKKNKIILSHILRNAFVPMVQYLPTTILFSITGSIYIESLYSIPGMGGLLVDAIQLQDNSLVQILVLIYASIGILGLFIGDLLVVLIDPRIKLDKKGEWS